MTKLKVRYKGKYATVIDELTKGEVFKLIKNKVKHKVLSNSE